MIKLCVLMTCFNRKQETLACLQALKNNNGLDSISLECVIVDDGSTDSTSEAINSKFPWVKVVQGTGSLYWCRGIHEAWRVARLGGYDYYLWLNDDTILYRDAISRLLACEKMLNENNNAPLIIVGSTVDEKTGLLTYGGEVRKSYFLTRFSKVELADHPQRCDSMNGNIVLISAAAMNIVGNIDPAFEHAMGDTDYALRANHLGVSVWVAPSVFGECSKNSISGTFADSTLPLNRRWKAMMSPKGLPWRSWLILTRRHTGLLWPIYFVWPYVRLVISSLLLGKVK
jgi:GT2 family glycosyltransferase